MKEIMIRRILVLFPTLVGISLLGFVLLELMPGDATTLLMRRSGGEVSAEAITNLRLELGLDRPWPIRYGKWVARAVRFDFGTSFSSGEPVRREIFSRLPATLALSLGAFTFMLMVTLPVGIFSALHKNRWADHFCRLGAIVFHSVPAYWLGLLLLWLFALEFDIFRIVGKGTVGDLVLPVFTLGIGMAAFYSRITRERVIDVLEQDYIRLVHAKGISRWVLIFRHTLKNALLPLITLWGISIGYLLSGSVIVESVFSWPGVGKLIVDAILNRDLPIIQAYVVLMAIFFMGINLIVDLVYPLLDPRLRAGRGVKVANLP